MFHAPRHSSFHLHIINGNLNTVNLAMTWTLTLCRVVALDTGAIYNGLGLIYTLNYTDVRVVGSIEEYALRHSGIGRRQRLTIILTDVGLAKRIAIHLWRTLCDGCFYDANAIKV